MDGLKRFEEVAAAYLAAVDEQRAAALAQIPEADREAFLSGVGLFHLLTDESFYRETCAAMAETVYREIWK